MNQVYYDNSQLSAFKECPRKYYLRHVLGWTGTGTSMPLAFGSCWHAAMDALWGGYSSRTSDSNLLIDAAKAFNTTWVENGLPPTSGLTPDMLEKWGARTPYVAMEMLYSYLEKRKATFDNPSFELESVEQPFAVPIYPNRSDVWYIGKLDKTFLLNGSRIIGEHKTTSEYKIDGGFKSTWLDSWSPSSQIEGYMYAGNLYFDGGVRYVWVDGALVHKKVHDAFKFIPIAANLSSLDGWLWEVRNWIEEVNIEKDKLANGADKGDYLTCFRRNTDACTGKYGPCTYKNICSNIQNPAKLETPPEGYKVEFWYPFDVLKIDRLGGEFTKPK